MSGSKLAGCAVDTAVVTAADMVAGHVRLDISCLDRLYLTGFVAKLQTPGGVIYFFHDHLGKPIVSPALFEPIGEKFRRNINHWAQANGVPVIRFKAGERKADVMAPYLQAAAAAGRSKVVAIGCAQEFQLVWTARKRDTNPDQCPQFSFTRDSSGCQCSTFTSSTPRWARGSSRSARTSLTRSRHGSTAMSGPSGRRWPPGSASPSCPTGSPRAATRPCCSGSATASAPVTCRPGSNAGWPGSRSRSPPPTGTPGSGGSCRCGQIETSRTLVFDDDVHARAFFEALLCDNMDLGRPENVELLFRRGQRAGRPTIPPAHGGFKTKIDRYCDLVTVDVFYKNSRLKQYLKDGNRDQRSAAYELLAHCADLRARVMG
jgi:hypothetical protein